MLGKYPVYRGASASPKGQIICGEIPCPHTLTHAVKRVHQNHCLPSRASPHPADQGANPSPLNPDEVEDEGTPGDADIPDSIVRALLDALQEKWAGNNILRALTPLVRIRTTQLKQCLLTARDPSDSTIQATLELIYMEQDTPGPVNIVDKVSTVSHIFECTTNQPSTTVPGQANNGSSGRTVPTSPTNEAAEVNLASFGPNNRQSSTVYDNANGTTLNAVITTGNAYSHNARKLTSEYMRPSSHHKLTTFHMTALDIPEQHSPFAVHQMRTFIQF